MGTKRHENRVLDVRKDRLDLRDREYRPILKSLPKIYPNVDDIEMIVKCYRAIDMILDQGGDGKCTGYALATVINYLLWRDHISDRYRDFLESPLDFRINKVSEQMLFNLARVYDEWDGEDYEGSSCRGAMKGWNKHGVCEQSCWEVYQDNPNEGWDKEARERPLGAYYRVDGDSISDMQSALCEVGALYVSASIHDGWWKLRDYFSEKIEDIPLIEYKLFPKGNHAFVIVGYTREGFVVQNSWGTTWGSSGFAILSYKDWLKHGMDVWVAVVGVPIDIEIVPHTYSSLSLLKKENERVEGTAIMKKALSYRYINRNLAPISEDIAYQHSLILNRYGRAKHTIIYTCSLDRSIDIICHDKIEAWVKCSPKHRKVALYALGSFSGEKESISKIRVMASYFLENGIYPIFLTWQTSSIGVIEKSINDFCQEMLTQRGVSREEYRSKQNMEALDRAIEQHTQEISTRAIWTEVKEKSLRANLSEIEELREINEKKRGVIYILTDSFQKLQKRYGNFEIHAIAHSFGSQLIATTWLEELNRRGMKLNSMHLLAPTLSLADSNRYIIGAVEGGVIKKKDIHLYMLDKEMECSDSIGEYGKSLLYLISRSLEKIHKTPLLGLEESWDTDNRYVEDGVFNTRQLADIRRWQNFVFDPDSPMCSINIFNKEQSQQRRSIDSDFIKLSHENFGSSISILEGLLEVISGAKLKYEVENLC
ncbi:C1 family peptidase [Sulfurovum sp. bin170]|uniref:C1 family peptidase n=1 Tax=Sulfurovum sp. bin170 TaxID=2695268 RepID=UPI0013DEC2A6|nr:C1 family peptidase [Sulfurovum sp. bin170]NEW60343.1 C1 family peptidase [Sulfurovum sp. bin170]